MRWQWFARCVSAATRTTPTTPRPDGSGMAAATRHALAIPRIEPKPVDSVNVDRGTRASDAAEGAALTTVFRDVAIRVLSESKGALGHGLGAASPMEVIDPDIGRRARPRTFSLAVVGRA